MDETQQSRAALIVQAAERIRASNLLSDTFAAIALEDVEACQYVVRKILGMENLRVTKVKGQYRLLNLTAKDAVLDVYAEDGDGRLINIEIQRRDTLDHARRTRYYSAMLDKSALDKGATYNELPDVYIIYISETDLWQAGDVVYPVNKTLGRAALPYDDGNHVIFVNAAVDDGSEIARLMQYFKTADPNDMSQGALSQRVRYLKQEKGGYETMCDAANEIFVMGREEGREEGRQEGRQEGREEGEQRKARETAYKLHGRGMSISDIADILEVSPEQVQVWLNLKSA